MSKRLRNEVYEHVGNQADFELGIVQAYVSGKFLVSQIADNYGITPRSVQRIVKKWGSGRTQAEGNRVAAPLRVRHKMKKLLTNREERKKRGGKSKDNRLDSLLRDIIIALMREQGRNFDYCELCGTEIVDGKFQIHHTKYEGATFADLLIVCQECNLSAENRYLD